MGIKNAKKGTDETIQRSNDCLVYRMMMLFLLATIAIVALLMLKKSGTSTVNVFVFRVLPWLKLAGGVILATAIAYFAVMKAKHIDETTRIVTSSSLLGCAIVLFSVFAMYKYFGSTKIVIVIIVALVLGFVYSFYALDFFWFSCYTTVQAVTLYAIKSGSSAVTVKNVFITVFKISAFVVPVLIIGFFLVLMLNKGNLKLGSHTHSIMKPNYLYYPFYIGAGIGLAGATLSILISGIAIYSILALLAAYLVFAIIYTVRMI